MALVKSETQAFGNYQQHSSRFASLHVSDLSPDVTEQDLIHKFSSTVPVVSVHLCRNSVTGKSLCYAYINFDSPSSASNAVACLNHTDLKGKAMRIMWSQRDLSYRRRTGFGNLYVKNLGSSITSSCLERMFCPFGAVHSCKVAEENGQSKGFGFVQFDTEQSAVAARSALHGSMVAGKKLFVAKFINKNERVAMAGHQEFTNVYVKNLIENVTEDTLHRLFSQYGTVSSVVVMRDGMGRSRGFGFVNFCHPVNAKKAVESLHGRQLGSKNLFVGRALRKDERREMLKQQFRDNFIAKPSMGWSNLYVKNLSESMNETRLREIFGSNGQIVSAKVMRHENGKSKGFGFVCFSNCEESKQAKRELNGFSVDGKPFVVRVAERKEDRLKRLQQYFHGQPRHYTQAPPVPSPAQPVLPSVPSSSYGYLQPFHGGTSYYYMGTQLPQMFGHQNITTYVPAGQAPLKEKRSLHLVYKHQCVTNNAGLPSPTNSYASASFPTGPFSSDSESHSDSGSSGSGGSGSGGSESGGSGSGGSGSGGSGSGGSGSTDSDDSDPTAACIIFQILAGNAIARGRREAVLPDGNEDTTIFDDVPSILLDLFCMGWNYSSANRASILPAIDITMVANAVLSAGYQAGILLDSLYDTSPKDLPTLDSLELFKAWRMAGLFAGCYMIDQYGCDTQLTMVSFSQFFTGGRWW